jgi:hypothetical protein
MISPTVIEPFWLHERTDFCTKNWKHGSSMSRHDMTLTSPVKGAITALGSRRRQRSVSTSFM